MSEKGAPQGGNNGDMVKGLSLFSLGITCYSFYTLCVKVATDTWGLNVPELYYYIQIIGIFFFLILTRIQGVDILGEVNRPGVKMDLFIRVFCGSFADVCLFLAFGYTNYSRAFCIFFTNNLMLPFMAKWILGEKVRFWDVVGIVSGFAGVLIMVQPWKVPEAVPGEVDPTFSMDMIGCGIAVIAALFAAVAITMMRRLA
jgi:drug/metabolite transporter (DMT)-like permease